MALIESKLLPTSEDVKIKITYTGTQPVLAVYDYQLKPSNSNTPIQDQPGDNQNSEDDIYSLPVPISDNVGRRVLVESKIAAINKDSDFNVKIDVIQDGKVTDSINSPGHVDANGEDVLSVDMIKFI